MDNNYNRVSLYQKNAVAQAAPFVEKTIASVMQNYVDQGQTFIIADYGSSLGLHSVLCLSPAVKKILETLPSKGELTLFLILENETEYG